MADPSPFSASLTPPYIAVIFTSRRSDYFQEQYAAMADQMEVLAKTQSGFLGMESARGTDRVGITVSYWRDRESARAWKGVAEHLVAQRLGQSQFYEWYRVRIATVSEEWGFGP